MLGGHREKATLMHCWWECRLVQPLWEAVWSFLKILKMELPYDPLIPLLGIYPKKSETIIWIYAHYVHCSIIYSSQDLEAAQMPISRWVDKTAIVYLHNRILLGHKKEGNLTLCNSLGGPGEYYAKWNKWVKERQVPYDFTYMWNLMNKKLTNKIKTDS